MLSFDSEVEYVASKVMERVNEEGGDMFFVIHDEVESYCSSLYDYKADELIASYGVIKAFQEYMCVMVELPTTSQALLCVLMVECVRECVGE